MDCEQWVADFVRSGGFAQFCEAILTRGLFGDGHPEKMMDAQQACLVSIMNNGYKLVLSAVGGNTFDWTPYEGNLTRCYLMELWEGERGALAHKGTA